MKRRFILAIVALALATPAALVLYAAQPSGPATQKAEKGRNRPVVWLTSYKQALEQSKATGKPILADFTGSDWCPGCIALKQEVLDTAAFGAWARERFVLLEVDFPNDKPQSPELKKQNAALAERFEVEYFPTVMVMDAGGREAGRVVGYRGQDWWMERINALAAKAPATQPRS